VRALVGGSSLLPAGLVEVSGDFERGETLSVCRPDGSELARGVVNYNNLDCSKLCGRHSREIEDTLGYFYGNEIIHRNNLVLL
jgi:glutamate 5-kinase